MTTTTYILMNLVGVRRVTAVVFHKTTGLGHSNVVVRPIVVRLSSAAFEVVLHGLPCFGNSIVFWLVVLGDGLFHVLLDEIPDLQKQKPITV